MVQIFLAIVIIALGIYVFKFYPFEKGNVMNLVLSAIFIMITLICKRFFTIMIPLFGLESLKIGIEYIPLMLAGYFLSPSYAFVIGLCCDLIGLILVPTGFPFFGFTLVMILVCIIPSLVKNYLQNVNEKRIQNLVMVLIVVLGIGASLYIYQLRSFSVSETVITLSLSQKIVLISICLALILSFVIVIIFLKKKIHEDEAKEFSIWMLSVILVEMICTLCLTPLWLDIMYGIPFVVSFCVRVIKECAILPIEIFIGYTLIKLLNRVLIRVRRS